MAPQSGALAVVLHAHLPFVLNHGRWPHGADWLSEAAAETYIPLLAMMRALENDGVVFKLTVGLTPVLCEQLASPVFHDEFMAYLENKVAIASDNEGEFSRAGQDARAALARNWREMYSWVRDEYMDVWKGSILGGFRYFEQRDYIDIMTCAATHGYLPLLGQDSAIQGQIKTGTATHLKHFGKRPRGIWLPECGYRSRYQWTPPVGPARAPVERKGVDEFLSENGIGFFIVDTHMMRGKPGYGPYVSQCEVLRDVWSQYEKRARSAPTADRDPHHPYLVLSNPEKQNPVAVFARDSDTGVVVWSSEHGYPGGDVYLDFHKKHFPGGLRYWRVTGPGADMGEKETYDPKKVRERLRENAGHFVGVVNDLLGKSDNSGILTAPFDAELFGHWWYEGVSWLEHVFRLMDPKTGSAVESVRLVDRLRTEPPREVISLPEGSWGRGGFHWIWLNEGTAALWERIYAAEERMENLAAALARLERKREDSRSALVREVLAQTARELMLLESSDWQFIISAGDARDYAESRFSRHADDFDSLAGFAERLLKGREPETAALTLLARLQERDFLFSEVDPLWWVPDK